MLSQQPNRRIERSPDRAVPVVPSFHTDFPRTPVQLRYESNPPTITSLIERAEQQQAESHKQAMRFVYGSLPCTSLYNFGYLEGTVSSLASILPPSLRGFAGLFVVTAIALPFLQGYRFHMKMKRLHRQHAEELRATLKKQEFPSLTSGSSAD